MDETEILKVLQAVQSGGMTVTAAMERFRDARTQPLLGAVKGQPRDLVEAVLAAGKSDVQLLDSVRAALAAGENCIVTRVTPAQAALISQSLAGWDVSYHAVARMVTVIQKPVKDLGRGEIVVVSAGISDQPVAEEAAITAFTLGNRVQRLFDVGLGMGQKLLQHLEKIQGASVVVVVSGMEGGLVSLVASLSKCPVIGVPTSVGYGTAFGGVASLLSMLNACVPGVMVVNVDNGFGAGVAAALVNRRRPFDAPLDVEPEEPAMPPLPRDAR